MRLSVAAAALAALSASTGFALAEYPDKPVTYIIAFSPGGGSDVGIRTWEPYFQKCLGANASFVAEYKPGAGGLLGFSQIANSPPDGYTFGNLNTPNSVQGPITGDGKYSMDQFDYLATMYGSNVMLVVAKKSPSQTTADFVKRTEQGELSVAVSGIGSDDHLALLQFAKLTNAKVRFIPFGSTADARNAVLGGHADAAGMSPAEYNPFADQLTALGFAAEKRSADAPDVPTFKEQGIDLIGGARHVIGGPKGMPKEAVDKITGCYASIAKDPDFLAEAKKRSLVVDYLDAQQTADYVKGLDASLREIWKTDPWVKK